jgi:hypothetical protein
MLVFKQLFTFSKACCSIKSIEMQNFQEFLNIWSIFEICFVYSYVQSKSRPTFAQIIFQCTTLPHFKNIDGIVIVSALLTTLQALAMKFLLLYGIYQKNKWKIKPAHWTLLHSHFFNEIFTAAVKMHNNKSFK